MKCLLALLLVFIVQITAAPHEGDIFNFGQPDGSKVQVLVWGDECYQRVESPDGYTLVRDDAGWICYAKLNSDGTKLISTGERYTPSSRSVAPRGIEKGIDISQTSRAQEIENSPYFKRNLTRNSRAFDMEVAPIPSTVVGLTIIVDFSDQELPITSAEITDFLNKKGYSNFGCKGSVRDYYNDVSGGKLDYTNITLTYRAQKPKSYYDANEQSGAKSTEFMKEVVAGAVAANASKLTGLTQREGAAIALNVIYAGEPTYGWAKGLWPHMYYLNNLRVGNLTFNAYQMTNTGKELKLSTFCHENGHMLGQWPDLYDYQSDKTNSSGVGHFCLMCHMGDPKNPVPPNGFFRYLAGWDELTDITATPKGTQLTHVSNSNTGFIYKNKSNSSEFFVIETRKRVGRSASLPAEGLAVWHIDKSMTSNDLEAMTSTRHYRVSLEQADGRNDLEHSANSGDAKDLFSATTGSKFTDATSPSAKWWNGSASGLYLANISAPGAQMTFTIGDQVVSTFAITASAATGGTISPTGTVAVAPGADQKFTITASEGYTVADVLVDNKSVGAVATYTFPKVAANHTISATFAKQTVLTVTYPNGGEELAPGTTVEIKWDGKLSGAAVIELMDNDVSVATLTSNATGNSFTWKIPADFKENAKLKVKITDKAASDLSDKSFAIKKIVLSENLTTFANWYIATDSYTGENASTGKLDTSAFKTEGWIGATLEVGIEDATNEIYPTAQLVADTKQKLLGATGVTVTYKSDRAMILALDQEGLDTLGESWYIELPASISEWATITAPLNKFAQPKWVKTKTSLNSEKIESISFQPVEGSGKTFKIQVKSLQVLGFKNQKVSLNETLSGTTTTAIQGITNGKVNLSVAENGLYSIEIYSIAGRVLESKQVTLQSGFNSIPLKSTGTGMNILRVSGNGISLTSKVLLQ